MNSRAPEDLSTAVCGSGPLVLPDYRKHLRRELRDFVWFHLRQRCRPDRQGRTMNSNNFNRQELDALVREADGHDEIRVAAALDPASLAQRRFLTSRPRENLSAAVTRRRLPRRSDGHRRTSTTGVRCGTRFSDKQVTSWHRYSIRQRVRILHFRSLRRYYLGRTRGRTILLSALFAAQIQILRLARIGVIWTVDESPDHRASGKRGREVASGFGSRVGWTPSLSTGRSGGARRSRKHLALQEARESLLLVRGHLCDAVPPA